MIKEYLAYLKDNPKNLWFKRKLYGWGWTPVRWQGWVVILAFVALMFSNALQVGTHSISVINFILETLVLVALLIYVCIRKGEKPRWQWGLQK